MIENIAQFSWLELTALFGESALKNIRHDLVIFGISTDTRSIKSGNAFVALIGENNDGHLRIEEAIKKGASAIIVSTRWYDMNSNSTTYPLIIVDDTLNALHLLANFHRNRFSLPIVVIGGANGKTTTKNITTHLLSSKYNVLSTFENYNNQIGVPMMLLMLSKEHDIAVLEIGTNEPGEIAILSELTEPTHGLITNIGREHLEKLIDLDGVEMEETFLFGFLHRMNGTCFINIDDARLNKFTRILETKVTYGTSDNAMVKAIIKLDDSLCPELEISSEKTIIKAKLSTHGYTTALNALASTAIAYYFGLSGEEISKGLKSYRNMELHGYGRMVVEKIGDMILINDCYNANPDSMSASLKALKSLKTDLKKVAVLGDMLELGDASSAEHIEVLDFAIQSADIILLTGAEMLKAMACIKLDVEIHWFEDKSELSTKLMELFPEISVVLVKGSRGMKMEEIVTAIKSGI